MGDFVGKSCNNCGAVQGETNRWWVIFEDDVDLVLRSLDAMMSDTNLLNRFEHPSHRRLYACSEQCVHKIISRWTSYAQDAPATS